MKHRQNRIEAYERQEYEIYTDLALEEREKYERNVEISGVVLEKKQIESLSMTVTKMVIEDKDGAAAMGKPEGTYITIESRMFMDEEEIYNKISAGSSENDIRRQLQKVNDRLSKVIFEEIKKIIKKLKKSTANGKILIVGLGNENATPDALGPVTAGLINIRENVTCIAPGVLAQTGMETYRIVKGIVREEKPDLIIAIDSLAARNTSRVATTVQITDTGITPGSGIGNHRMGLNKETLGIPVIAIGVPMVVNSVTIVHDTMEQLLEMFKKYEELNDVTRGFSVFNREEKYILIDEIMSGAMGKMYVTPKDVDEMISRIGKILAQAINMISVETQT